MYIFLCDVDGTLIKDGIALPEKVITAVHRFINAGGYLALCTGRSVVAAKEIAQQLDVNMPCILYGGAALYDFRKEEFMYVHGFVVDIKPILKEMIKEHPRVSLQVFTKNDIYIIQRNERLNEYGVKEENVGSLRSLEDVEGEVIKLVMCADDPEDLMGCQKFFPEEYCDFAFAGRHFVDIVARNAGKSDALNYLSGCYQLKKENFICAGDAITDLLMLKAAGLSFAPDNALEQVKKVVDYVVPSVRVGGMEVAFRIATDYIRRKQRNVEN